MSNANNGSTLRRKEYLHRNIRSFSDDVFAAFPDLQEAFPQFVNTDRESDKLFIPLPSVFPLHHSAEGSFRLYCECEFKLRVGHGHDLLNSIRNAIGLGTFLSRYHKHTWGIQANERVCSQRKRAGQNLQHLTKQYRKNWEQLCHLRFLLNHEAYDALQGLEELLDHDLRYLNNWVSIDDPINAGVKKSGPLPWIWKVTMLEIDQQPTGLRSAIKEWESEGQIY